MAEIYIVSGYALRLIPTSRLYEKVSRQSLLHHPHNLDQDEYDILFQ